MSVLPCVMFAAVAPCTDKKRETGLRAGYRQGLRIQERGTVAHTEEGDRKRTPLLRRIKLYLPRVIPSMELRSTSTSLLLSLLPSLILFSSLSSLMIAVIRLIP